MVAGGVLLGLLTLNPLTGFHIALGAFFYVVIYTVWLKRRSTLNIVIGGFAGSAAALAGWSSFAGSLNLQGALVAGIVFLWTPSHFWALALSIREDYASADVPMLPAVVSPRRSAWAILLNSVLLVGFSTIPFFLGAYGLAYLVVALASGALLLTSNLRLLKDPAQRNAWRSFKIAGPYLVLVLVGMLLDLALA